MMNIRIRLANANDEHHLLILLKAFHGYLQIRILSQDNLHLVLVKLMKDPMCDFALAVTHNGEGLAYTQIRYFSSLWSLGLEAKLEDLYAIPQARRQGLGSKLLAFSINRACQRQCRLIALNTNERNIAAKNLYIQSGFSFQPSRWQGGQQLWLEQSL